MKTHGITKGIFTALALGAALIHCTQSTAKANARVPTLAIVGSEDGSTPPDMVRETADLIAGSQFKVIRKAGHLPCVEQPAEMAALISKFMVDNKLG